LLRAFLINPILVALLAIVALGIVRVVDLHVQTHNLILAATISAVVAEISLIPLLITRRKSQAVISQAGLISTMLHTMLCAAVGMAVASLLHAGQPLMYWLMLFYPATLLSVAMIAIRAVKSAPIHTT
jgi:hypothetical protein